MDSVLSVGGVDNVDKLRAVRFYRICRVLLAVAYLPIGAGSKKVLIFFCG